MNENISIFLWNSLYIIYLQDACIYLYNICIYGGGDYGRATGMAYTYSIEQMSKCWLQFFYLFKWLRLCNYTDYAHELVKMSTTKYINSNESLKIF